MTDFDLSLLTNSGAQYLVQCFIVGTVLFTLAALADLALKNQSAALRHRVWALATLCVLIAPILLPALQPLAPDWRITLAWPTARANSATQPNNRSVEVLQLEPLGRLPSSTRSAHNQRSTAVSTADAGSERAADSSPNATGDVVHSAPPVTGLNTQQQPSNPNLLAEVEDPTTRAEPSIVFRNCLLAMWGLGVVLGLGSYVQSFRNARQIVQHGIPISAVDILQLVDTLRRELGIRFPVCLMCSERTVIPLTVGLSRHSIVLPIGYGKWDDERTRIVLGHELAHIRRADLLWQMLASLVRVFYWCHPLAWLAIARMRSLREFACDDAVLQIGEGARSYASHLVDIAAELAGRRQPLGRTTLAMASNSKVERRVTLMLQSGRRRAPVKRSTGICLVAIAMLVVFAAGVLSPGFVSSHDVARAADPASDTATSQNSPNNGQARILGKVVDQSGKGVANVDLWIVTDPFSDKAALHAATGGDGRFEIPVPDEKRGATIWALNPKFSLQAQSIRSDPDGGYEELELELQPPATTSFVVLDPSGKPFAGATLEPWNFRAGTVPESVRKRVAATTDTQGRAKLPAVQRDGLWYIRVQSDQFGIQKQQTLYSGSEEIEEPTVRLRQVGRIVGRLRGDDPRWISGVKLSFSTSRRSALIDEPEGVYELTTDRRGRFEIPQIAIGQVSIYDSLDRSLPVRLILPKSDDVFVSAGETTRLELPLEPTVAVRGRVVVQGSDEPVVGARVRIRYGVNIQGEDAVTGEDGRFESQVLPGKGYMTLIYIPPKYNADQVGYNAADHFDVPATNQLVQLPVIELVPKITRTATVVDREGKAVADRNVTALAHNKVYARAKTDRAGRVELQLPKGLSIEKLEVMLDGESVVAEPVTQNPLAYRLPKPKTDDEAEQRRPVIIRGRVVLLGQPLSGAQLRLQRGVRSTGGGTSYKVASTATTDEDGNYELSGLFSGDYFKVDLTSPANVTDPRWRYGNSVNAAVEDKDGTMKLPDMQLVKTTQTLGGVCIDLDGNPIEGAEVRVTLPDGGWLRSNFNSPVGWKNTDSNGRFRFTNLPDMPLSLRAVMPSTGTDERARGMASVVCKKNDLNVQIQIQTVKSTSSGFQEWVRQVAKERAKVTAYDVTITGKVNNTTERVMASNGKVYESTKTPIALTLKMIYDTGQSKFLVARKDTYRHRETGEEETTKWQVFGRKLGPLPDERPSVSDGRFIGHHTKFFDPLALGMVYGGEYHNGQRWEVLIRNYLEWGDNFWVQHLADKQVYFASNNNRYIIDTQRGFWPLLMDSRDGDRVRIHSELDVIQVNGIWLPKTATVRAQDETTDLRFEWHSVNQPIAKERFTAEDINRRFDLSLRAR